MLTESLRRDVMLDTFCSDTGSAAVDYGMFSRVALCGSTGVSSNVVSSGSHHHHQQQQQQQQQQMATSLYHSISGSTTSYARSTSMLPGSSNSSGGGNSLVGGVPSSTVGSISGVGARSSTMPYGVGFALTAQDIVHQPLTFQGLFKIIMYALLCFF